MCDIIHLRTPSTATATPLPLDPAYWHSHSLDGMIAAVQSYIATVLSLTHLPTALSFPSPFPPTACYLSISNIILNPSLFLALGNHVFTVHCSATYPAPRDVINPPRYLYTPSPTPTNPQASRGGNGGERSGEPDEG